MAFAKFFGWNDDDPNSESNTSDKERENPGGTNPVQGGTTGHHQPSYQYPSQHLPYQLPSQQQHGSRYPSSPGRGMARSGSPYQQYGSSFPASPGRDHSQTAPASGIPYQSQTNVHHPLDGVGFILSPLLKIDNELDYITAAVDSVMAKIEDIDWAALEYSFELERSVLVNDLLGNRENTED